MRVRVCACACVHVCACNENVNCVHSPMPPLRLLAIDSLCVSGGFAILFSLCRCSRWLVTKNTQ